MDARAGLPVDDAPSRFRAMDGAGHAHRFRGRSGRQHDGGHLELLREVGHRASAALWNAELDRDRAEALRRQVLADRRKDEFLAMLGHELRNPLSPIMTAVELMERRNDVRFERECRIIQRQATHLMQLVDDLLDISRITRGQLAAAQGAARDLGDPGPRRRGGFAAARSGGPSGVDRGAHGPGGFGDAFRRGQVFRRCCQRREVHRSRGRIRSPPVAKGARSWSIRRHGCGIPKELLRPSSSPSSRASARSTARRGGLGLGLALVRRLSELHGGVVSVDSGGSGQGSTFTVRRPALASGANERCPPSPPRRAASAARRRQPRRHRPPGRWPLGRGDEVALAYERRRVESVAQSSSTSP